MNVEMAYLLGMILGNGEIQRGATSTRVTIDIPHKNVQTDDGLDTAIYVQASLIDIEDIIRPLIGTNVNHLQERRSTKISFEKDNKEYVMREIVRFLSGGTRHHTMMLPGEAFNMTRDEKKSLLRGFADVTAYIRKSNIAFGHEGHHRVYIEIPVNWEMVIGISNLLKSLDIPVQTIDFGHPNFRDSNVTKYNEGKNGYWKKEHQVKIWANEFLPIGFNIKHKQQALEKYAEELLETMDSETTHKFYWEKPIKVKRKPNHPAESDGSLPRAIRGRHFESWTQLAQALGYHE